MLGGSSSVRELWSSSESVRIELPGLRRRAFHRLLRYVLTDDPHHPITARITVEEQLLDRGVYGC